MVNLIGLLVGREIAKREKASDEDVARFGLLGAAAPSPLLGAILVQAAVNQTRRTKDGGNGRGSDESDGSDGTAARTSGGGSPRPRAEVKPEAEEELAAVEPPPDEVTKKLVALFAALDHYEEARKASSPDVEAVGDARANAEERWAELDDAMRTDPFMGS